MADRAEKKKQSRKRAQSLSALAVELSMPQPHTHVTQVVKDQYDSELSTLNTVYSVCSELSTKNKREVLMLALKLLAAEAEAA
jgi:hypothetical protein